MHAVVQHLINGFEEEKKTDKTKEFFKGKYELVQDWPDADTGVSEHDMDAWMNESYGGLMVAITWFKYEKRIAISSVFVNGRARQDHKDKRDPWPWCAFACAVFLSQSFLDKEVEFIDIQTEKNEYIHECLQAGMAVKSAGEIIVTKENLRFSRPADANYDPQEIWERLKSYYDYTPIKNEDFSKKKVGIEWMPRSAQHLMLSHRAVFVNDESSKFDEDYIQIFVARHGANFIAEFDINSAGVDQKQVNTDSAYALFHLARMSRMLGRDIPPRAITIIAATYDVNNAFALLAAIQEGYVEKFFIVTPNIFVVHLPKNQE